MKTLITFNNSDKDAYVVAEEPIDEIDGQILTREFIEVTAKLDSLTPKKVRINKRNIAMYREWHG